MIWNYNFYILSYEISCSLFLDFVFTNLSTQYTYLFHVGYFSFLNVSLWSPKPFWNIFSTYYRTKFLVGWLLTLSSQKLSTYQTYYFYVSSFLFVLILSLLLHVVLIFIIFESLLQVIYEVFYFNQSFLFTVRLYYILCSQQTVFNLIILSIHFLAKRKHLCRYPYCTVLYSGIVIISFYPWYHSFFIPVVIFGAFPNWLVVVVCAGQSWLSLDRRSSIWRGIILLKAETLVDW